MFTNLFGVDPVQKVTLASSNLQKSIDYWNGLLGLEIFAKNLEKRNVLLGFNANETKLELQEIGKWYFLIYIYKSSMLLESS